MTGFEPFLPVYVDLELRLSQSFFVASDTRISASLWRMVRVTV